MSYIDGIIKASSLPLRRPKNGEKIRINYYVKSQHEESPILHVNKEGIIEYSDEEGFCLKEENGKLIVVCDNRSRSDNRIFSYTLEGINYKAFDFVIKRR